MTRITFARGVTYLSHTLHACKTYCFLSIFKVQMVLLEN